MLVVPFLSRATSRARCKGPSRIAFGAISTRSPAILPRSSPALPILRTCIIVKPTESQNQVRYYCSRSGQTQKADHPKAKSTSEKAGNPAVHTPSGTNEVIHEDIYTVPNVLTITRLIAAPVVGYLVLHDSHAWAVGLFAYAGITDLLDGWIARKWNRKTVVGTVIDPMADKALMTILTICLAAKGALPCMCPTGRNGPISGNILEPTALPDPHPQIPVPSVLTISVFGALLALVGLTTAAPLVDTDLTSALTTLQYVVAATTVWSGASYVFSKDAVKILK
ncbi:phosphatidyl synthase [Metarhizium acridum CQMa 102]|uniref:Phosphatidyl synthase n=1 Tax=Metarhizium acridum (strain CQMa 102) TaxID=655827 RepID=E9DW93_METAQ|nr:phosphatidyl synthase [Metarhizium acridum CQMa 102]EFY91943.1 phosphatidyl synthase [Metarhizium acridum CQMa 102]